MAQTLWGNSTVPRRRQRRRRINNQSTPATPYSITGSNDCQIIGHTEGHRDLAGCTVCLDCGVIIYSLVVYQSTPKIAIRSLYFVLDTRKVSRTMQFDPTRSGH